ncbi:MAG TPA: HAMP domain-containing sensor histidine kinase [Sandaracinaceae bacterium LLY-WYZ-13_1]|nr:HAMP domain-containing sensor histidine kinase [Sandaracinaceae bacterium LLY-WYZ-13_1]
MVRIETLKGTAFVLATGALLFVGARFALRRIASHEAQLAEARQALMTADARASAGVLAASIAHDLNNVLTMLHMGLEELRQPGELGRNGRDEVFADMDRGLRQASSLSTRLSRAARRSATGTPEDVDLVAVAREALELVALHPAARDRRVELEADETVRASAYPQLVQQVVWNLVLNAVQATGPGGHTLVRIHAPDGPPVIEVHDDGPGVAPGARTGLFEPFYSTKEEGTGLGLLSVRLCAELHSGRAEIDDSPRGGACFRVVLGAPVTRGPPEALTEGASA